MTATEANRKVWGDSYDRLTDNERAALDWDLTHCAPGMVSPDWPASMEGRAKYVKRGVGDAGLALYAYCVMMEKERAERRGEISI